MFGRVVVICGMVKFILGGGRGMLVSVSLYIGGGLVCTGFL